MKQPNEKPIEAKLRKGVERLGGLCLKLPAVYFTGIPDRLCLLPGGRLYFVETKSSGKDLSPRQLYVKRQLEGLGFQVFKIDSEAALAEFLREIEAVKRLDRLAGAEASEVHVNKLESYFENRRPGGPRFLVKLPGEEVIVEPYRSYRHLEALQSFDWRKHNGKALSPSEAVELESLILCQERLAELGEELSARDRASLEKLQSKSGLV